MTTIYKAKYTYSNKKFYENYGVAVSEGKIIKVASLEELIETYTEHSIEEWSNLALIPGTVNIHNHCFQSLLRGLACDRPFLEWRDNALYKYSNLFSKEDIYGGAVFAFSEMMKYGVTTVCDFFYLHNFGIESDDMIVKAAKDVGIRLVLARTMYDWDGAPKGYQETVDEAVENTRFLAEKYNNKDQMVNIIPAPHSMHGASPEMIKAGHKLAKELGTGFHIHIAEEEYQIEQVKKDNNGKNSIEVLDDLGVVDDSLTLVHGVWLEQSEIELLGERGASLAYCPSSNMFLADGITDIPAMMKNNISIGLGSDGACSNNRISVFEEMRMVALLQKANTCDAMSVNYMDAFKMGTENGGKILNLPIGKIEEGYKADFVGININDISMQPISKSLEQLLPNIVYSMQPNAIEKVVVDGKLTVSDGKNITISEEDVVRKVREIMNSLEDNND